MNVILRTLPACAWLLASFISTPNLARSDDLDGLVDYLVHEREIERSQTHATSSTSTAIDVQKSQKQFFRNSGDYRIDPISRNAVSGVLETSTTYYPTANGTSFSVRIVQAETSKRVLDETYVSEVHSLALTFTQARKVHALTVAGLPSAYLEIQGNTVRSAITRIRKDTYLVVRSHDWLPSETFGQFLSALPFDELDSVLTTVTEKQSAPA